MNDSELLQQAYDVLRQISLLGGNLPDNQYLTRSGPNEAVARGIKYTEARRAANALLFAHGQPLAPMTYFEPTEEQLAERKSTVIARGHQDGITMEDAKRALDSDGPRFQLMPCGLDDENVVDLLRSVTKNELHALTDEDSGGIVGYILTENRCLEIANALNASPVAVAVPH